MKKFISLVLVVLLLLMCAACGNESKDETNSSTPTTTNPSSNNNESTDNAENNKSDGAITTTNVKNHKETPASDFTYEYNDDGIKITKYNGTDTIVVIPDKIDGKPVTELKSYLFANDSAVKGVYIPQTVKSLSYMFTNNDNVEVVICEGVEALKKAVFLNCAALHTIVLGESLSEMGEFCIATCPNLLSVYICPKVTKIAQNYNEIDVLSKCPKVTVRGVAGSYIQTYAEANGIPFEAK